MSISEPFIRRPIATSLLMLGILVFGIAAYNLLPVAALPNVDFPTIVVSASYPGASPETMASSVATPLEQQFAAIPGLAEMTSTSGVGTTTITLQFDLDRNIDAAAQDVQQAINAATGLLPKDLPNPPTYRKTNPADRPVLIYAVHSDAMPVYRIDDYAYTMLAQQPGERQRRLGSAHLRPEALCRARAGQPGGAGGARHRPRGRPHRDRGGHASTGRRATSKGAHQTVTLDTNDQLFDAAGFRNVIVAYRNGAPVRLGDIAEVDRRRAERAHRRLVRRQAGRGPGDPARGRRQHASRSSTRSRRCCRNCRNRSRRRSMSIWSPTARW